jgi:hypothetical protein
MDLHRKMKGCLVATLLAAGLLAAAPAAAHDDQARESGSKGCSQNETQRVRSYSSGHTHVYPGPTGYAEYSNGGDLTVKKTYANDTGGGDWKVTTNALLSAPGTYAECITTGPSVPHS